MEKLHIDLLLLLRDAGQYGLDEATLLADARQTRHRNLTQPDLERALRDLADRSFVTTQTSALKKMRWRVTGFGVSALQEENL